jgi:outer membrane immunogenic protein
MRNLLLGTAMSLAFVGGASAADMYVKAPPPYSWTGFYIGGNIGGGWAQKDWFEDATGSGSGFGPVGFHDASYTASGFLGGGQAGYNLQSGRWIFGIEGDFSGANITGNTSSCFTQVVGTIQSCSTNVKSLGTVTGRFGTAWDRTLLYVTGGAAWIREDHANGCNACSFTGGPNVWTASETRGGWLVGIGAEYAFAGPWSAKLEYDYVGLGTQNVGKFIATPSGAPFTEDIRQNMQLVKFGVNYRFGSGPIATRY